MLRELVKLKLGWDIVEIEHWLGMQKNEGS